MESNNRRIADILRSIADLLSLKGESRFRIAAYENAADSLEFLDRDARDIYRTEGQEGLEEIENIGKSTADKIAEFLETGQITYYEDLKRNVPPIATKLMKIPGVGPKTAERIAERLKIEDLAQLPSALESPTGRRHFKPKARENILHGLQFLLQQKGRILISKADEIASEIISALTKSEYIKKIDPVGSLRRRKETIGDLDIIVASDNPPAVTACLVNQPFVREVVSQGETKATIIHRSGIQVDLEVLPPNEYGSLLQHFTGSKEHNVHLRTYAESLGLSISEHGIKMGNKLIRCADENCIYHHLKMPWIPPELREDRGEIEAALANRLPNLIRLSDIRGDLHTHSNWTDGRSTIAEMAAAARDLGREYIVIADHTKGLGIAGGLDEQDVWQRQKEIEKARQNILGITILSGLEVDIKADGNLDMSDSLLSQMDVITASIHSGFQESRTKITSRILQAMDNPHVDIIGHPSGRLINVREEISVDWQIVFRHSAETKTALEINSLPNRLDLKDVLVQQAQGFGVKFAINTDAHHVDHLSYMRFGIGVARRGWLEKDDVINTFPLPVLQEYLKRVYR